MDALLQDVRYALRKLRLAPAFAAAAILSLALGIGATTTMFSVVDAVDFRPLPYPNADRLVMLWEARPRGDTPCPPTLGCRTATSMTGAADWRAQSRALDAIGLIRSGERYAIRGDESDPINTFEVSAELFPMLGARPMLGPGFQPADFASGADPVIVLSYDLWRSRYGGDPRVVGSRIMMMDAWRQKTSAYTVAGVMPEHFRVLSEDSWTQIQPIRPGVPESRAMRFSVAIARLTSGRTMAQARVEARTIATRLAAEYPETNKGWSADVSPFDGASVALQWSPDAGAKAGRGRFVLLIVVSFVLLVATINVAALFLVRGNARRHELSVRSALGASRTRLVRQLIIECLCIAIAGGALGALLALWGVRLASMALYLNTLGIRIDVDRRVLLFAALISLASGLAAGIAPALQLSRSDLTRALRERATSGGRRQSIVQSALIAGQVAGALVLIAGAALLSKELMRLRNDAPGYDARGLYELTFVLPRKLLGAGEHRVLAERAGEEVSRVAGVTSAGAFSRDFREVARPGRDAPFTRDERPEILDVSPTFLRTMRIPILRGRALEAADRDGSASVAVIDETAAALLWPHQDALGKTLVFPDSVKGDTRATVVGIAARARFFIIGLTDRARATLYLPQAQASETGTTVWVDARIAGDASRAIPALRAAIHGVTGAPVDKSHIVSREERIAGELRQQRFDSIALGAFAIFGLMLSALGIYGAVAYMVMTRTREIGIRIALGAERGSVLRMMLRYGVVLGATGIVAGLAGSFALTRILRSMLIGTSATDPVVFAGSAAILAVIVLVAALGPARRATKVDPMIALRAD